MSRVGLIVELDIEEAQFEAFLAIVRAHGEKSLAIEAGCLGFDLYLPRGEGAKAILVETYADDAALESHWKSEHMAAYRTKTAGMIKNRVAHRCDG